MPSCLPSSPQHAGHSPHCCHRCRRVVAIHASPHHATLSQATPHHTALPSLPPSQCHVTMPSLAAFLNFHLVLVLLIPRIALNRSNGVGGGLSVHSFMAFHTATSLFVTVTLRSLLLRMCSIVFHFRRFRFPSVPAMLRHITSSPRVASFSSG